MSFVRALAITASLSLALTAIGVTTATTASAHRMHGHVMTGPTGNKVEMVEPYQSMYVPRIGRASARDQAKAQKLLDGVNNFCRTHTAAGIKARWRPGTQSPSAASHFFNSGPRSKGLNPKQPRAALIYKGRLRGVMFSGAPLPSLGSIPRAHSHNMSKPDEMVHVYCTKNLRDAFTPSRRLGINGDMNRLRDRIRPGVMDLNERQLRVVRNKVRAYTDKMPPMSSIETTSSGPDPVLQALRTQIRQSLRLLNEPQLRSVWRLMG